MSIRPSRLITTVIAFTILLPIILFSQVKIKEKVEIKPGSQRSAPQIAKTYDFFSPPLFVGDSSFTVTLNSSLAYSGTVSVSDDIGYDQTAEVGIVFHDPINPSVIYDTALAWKGRQPVAWGGNLIQGQRTVPLICNRGTAPPEVQLLRWRNGFDGFGQRHMTGDDRHISYSFIDTLTAKDGSPLRVVGSAFISGSSLTSARFSSWKIKSDPYIQCRGAVTLLITPLDSSGAEYSPAIGSDTLTGSFKVSVRAHGSYVYLQGAEQEGSQVTVSLPQEDEIDLVLDTQLGEIPGGVDTAFVTVTGGGRSATHKVTLYSYGLHFDFGTIQTVQHGEIRQLRAAIRDGCSNDVDYPGVHYYKFELLGNSSTWGVLRDTLRGRSGAVVDSVSSTRIEFDSWGMNPESPATVTVRVSVDDGTIEPVTASFTVMPAQMRAILGKKVLSYGDTTSLKIQIQNPDGSWMDKPAAWTGTYTIVQADTFGYLYNLDSSKVGRVITDTSPILIYYARPESQPDSVKILIQLMLEEPPPPFPFGQMNSAGNVSTQAQGVASQPKVSGGLVKRPPAKVSGGIVFGGAIHWGDVELEEKKQNEILLGETKFYEAYIDQDNGNKLAIKELKETSEWTGPELVVDFKVDPIQGGKLGVYYESRDREGDPVVRNLIRLVGRYWEKDNPYKVKLTATYNGQIATKDIDVKKPNKLFDWAQVATVDEKEFNYGAKDYSTTKDLFGVPLNIDSLILCLAGESGIPPQMIKAQMFQEADRTGFHFNPSYRYEPWKDHEYQTNKEETDAFFNQPFYITAQLPQGAGPVIPRNHSNLYPKGLNPEGYPTNSPRICDYAINNWWDYTHTAGNNLEIVGSSYLTRIWQAERARWTLNWIVPGVIVNPVTMATSSVQSKIRQEYTQLAQTRKVASYGFLQMMYLTALGFEYGGTGEPPEALNDQTILIPFYRNFTLENLRGNWGENVTSIPDHEWPVGWEASWTFALKLYNGKVKANEVMKRFRYFDPQS